jgi:hypothetical protein
MLFLDKNGKEIKLKDCLDVPLDIFSNGVVTKDENNNLALELRYESKKIPLHSLSENIFKYIKILN